MIDSTVKEAVHSNGSVPYSRRRAIKSGGADERKVPTEGIRVFVAAENRLVREALARVLAKGVGIEVIATDSAARFDSEALLNARADILLLNSRGSLEEDLAAIQQVCGAAAGVRILLIGMGKNEREFLKCVR